MLVFRNEVTYSRKFLSYEMWNKNRKFFSMAYESGGYKWCTSDLWWLIIFVWAKLKFFSYFFVLVFNNEKTFTKEIFFYDLYIKNKKKGENWLLINIIYFLRQTQTLLGIFFVIFHIWKKLLID